MSIGTSMSISIEYHFKRETEYQYNLNYEPMTIAISITFHIIITKSLHINITYLLLSYTGITKFIALTKFCRKQYSIIYDYFVELVKKLKELYP